MFIFLLKREQWYSFKIKICIAEEIVYVGFVSTVNSFQTRCWSNISAAFQLS